VLAEDVTIGIPTTITGPEGIPVSGVRPVCPSAKLSSPTVNRFKPAVAIAAVLGVENVGNDDGLHPTPTAYDTNADADGTAAVNCVTSAVTELLTECFMSTVATDDSVVLALVTFSDELLL